MNGSSKLHCFDGIALPAGADQLYSFQWRVSDDFLQITSDKGEHSRLYLDEILAFKVAAGSAEDCATLIAYPLVANARKRVQYELKSAQCKEMVKALARRLQRRIPPHQPRGSDKERRTLVLVNPFSGQKTAMKLWKTHAEYVFQEAEVPYEVRSTKAPLDAIRIAQELDLDKYDGVAIASGDGLVNEVITGLLTRKDRDRALKLPILHIPAGTGNSLAAAVAFLSNEPFPPRGVFCRQLALMCVKPKYRPLRLYHVEVAKEHRAMFMSCSYGILADIDIDSERFRWMGMIRLHMEAVCKLIDLPNASKYRAKISYVPVTDKNLLRKSMLKATAAVEAFGDGHFFCEEVAPFEGSVGASASSASSVEEAFRTTELVKTPKLDQPVPSTWEVIESEYILVTLCSLSHIGSDLPYIPSARMEEEVFYLTLVDWWTLKSRLHMAHLLITVDRCRHLTYPCLQMIPVLACRVEPAPGAGGHVAIDGEACAVGAPFQVTSTKLQATVMARERRNRAQQTS